MVPIIFPGTFDPITFGHIDIINRLLKIHKNIIILVIDNINKSPLILLKDRLNLIKQYFNKITCIKIETTSNLLVDYLKKNKFTLIVRGIRNYIDFEYETKIALLNKILYNQVETIFISSREEYKCISSSSVKEILHLGGNIKSFVPIKIERFLIKLLKL